MKYVALLAIGFLVGVGINVGFYAQDNHDAETSPTLEPYEVWHGQLADALGEENHDFANMNNLYELRRDLAVSSDLNHLTKYFDRNTCELASLLNIKSTNKDDFQLEVADKHQELIDMLIPPATRIQQTPTIKFRESVLATATYRLDYIVFSSRVDEIDVHAYVLLPYSISPDGAGYPAVVLSHANSDNIEAMVGINPNRRLDRTNLAAIQYVEQGVVVVVPYLIEDDDERIRIFLSAQLEQLPPYYTIIQRILSSVDYLETQSDFPISRVGLHGLSFGGTMSLFAGIVDDRIDSVALSNSVRDYSYWLYGNDDDRNFNVNKILWFFDWCNWDMQILLSHLIPKRVYVESSELDKRLSGRDFDGDRYSEEPLDMTTITTITDQIADLYRQLGIADDFRAVTFPGQHVINVDEAVPWMIEQLTRD